MEKNRIMEISNEEKATEFANYFAGETDYKENAAYSAAMAMADWKDEQHKQEKQQLIDKAAEWLRMTMDFFNNGEFNTEKFVNDFKQEMEKQFFDKVVEMRKLQKEYFRKRDAMVLKKAKEVEAEIDAEMIAERNGNQHYCKNCDDCCQPYNSTDNCFKSAMQAMELKDKQFAREKQQLIEKACEEYCNGCDYMACRKYNYDNSHCRRYVNFKKAMKGE